MVRIGKYVIKGDSTNYMVGDALIRPEGSKTGEPGTEYYRYFKYHKEFSGALRIVFSLMCRDVCAGDELISLEDAIRDMRRVEAHIQELLQGKVDGL